MFTVLIIINKFLFCSKTFFHKLASFLSIYQLRESNIDWYEISEPEFFPFSLIFWKPKTKHSFCLCLKFYEEQYYERWLNQLDVHDESILIFWKLDKLSWFKRILGTQNYPFSYGLPWCFSYFKPKEDECWLVNETKFKWCDFMENIESFEEKKMHKNSIFSN